MRKIIQKVSVKSDMYLKEFSDHISSIGQPKLPVNYFSGTVNFGDLLNIDLIEKILSVKVVKSNGKFRDHLLGIGSVLELANSRSTIWGSGFMFEDGRVRSRPAKILALRGQLSLSKVEKEFGEKLYVPLGDPGFLYPSIFGCEADLASDKVGILPHYSDLNHSSIIGPLPDNFTVIDPRRLPAAVLADMAKCSCIISSSLHGCILGDALGVRVKRLRFVGSRDRGDFKYLDYETTLTKPDTVSFIDTFSDIATAVDLATTRESTIQKQALIDALVVNANAT